MVKRKSLDGSAGQSLADDRFVPIGLHLQNRYSGKSRNFVKILYSGVRSFYVFAVVEDSVSDWDCEDCTLWNGIWLVRGRK